MNENPASKDIDIKTKKGLELLKIKAKYYGHYAEQLKVLDLIKEIEFLKEQAGVNTQEALNEAMKKWDGNLNLVGEKYD